MIRSARGFVLGTVTLLLTTLTTLAIYPEQQAIHWKHENIGVVVDVVFHQRHAVVVTDANVVAALSMRKGDLAWRRALPKTSIATKLILDSTSVSVLCSDGHLFVWHIYDGSLLWDIALSSQNKQNPRAAITDAVWAGSSGIAVAIDNSVFLVDDGEVTHNWTVSGEKCTVETVGYDWKNKKVYAGYSCGTDRPVVEAVEFKLYSDDDEYSENVPAVDDVVVGGVRESENVLVVRTVDGKALVSVLEGEFSITDLSTAQVTRVSFADVGGVSGLSQPTTITASLSAGFVVSDSQGKQTIIHVKRNEDKSVKIELTAETVSQGAVVHDTVVGFSSTFVYSNFVLVTSKQSHGTELTVLSEDGTFSQLIEDFEISRGFLQQYTKKSGQTSWRILTQTTTAQLTAITTNTTTTTTTTTTNNINTLWTREESLAFVVGVEIVVLDSSGEGSGVSSRSVAGSGPPRWSELSFVADIVNAFDVLQNTLKFVAQEGMDHMIKLKQVFEERLERVLTDGAEAFKPTAGDIQSTASGHVICLTKGGHVFSLSLATGEIVWKRYWNRSVRPGIEPSGANSVVPRMFLARRQGVFSAVVAVSVESHDGVEIVFLDSLSGEEISSVHASAQDVVDVFLLPTTDSTLTHHIGVMSSDLSVQVFSSQGDSKTEINKPIYHVTWSQTDIVGHVIDPATPTKMQSVWRVAFQGKDVVSHVFMRRKHAKVASPVHVLGNRNILHKYINPNLLAVATTNLASQPGEEFVSLYLIDTVSGKIVHETTHPHCSGPARVVVMDNNVFLTFWNTQARQTELVVFELYESRRLDAVLDVVTGSMQVPSGFHNLTHYSSASRPIPDVISRQYFVPKPVSTICVTETNRGVTAKQLLLGLSSDQIIGIDRRFVNPRQTDGTPTEADQTEELVKYNMYLPFHPLSVVTTNRTVLHLREMTTEAGTFESESHMIGVGTDLIYIPLQPSGQFDGLSSDFNRGLLVVAMATLLLILLLVRSGSKRKELRKKWS